MITLPVSQASRNKEWATIITMAKNIGFPENIIRNLRTKRALKKQNHESTTNELDQKWVPFAYFGPAMRRITNLFKDSTIKIAFKTTNSINKQLPKCPYNIQNPSGIYELKCNTFNKIYVGQPGSAIDIRYKEHIRYVRTNNPQSAYATHILQNRHEYGPRNDTLQLLKACTKGTHMNRCEAMYIQKFHREGILIAEQQVYELNPLYDCIYDTRLLHRNQPTVPSTTAQDTYQQENTDIT